MIEFQSLTEPAQFVMFSGIVIAVGAVTELSSGERSALLTIDSERFFSELRTLSRQLSIGESVLVNGVCLTVVEFTSSSMSFDLASETLRLTNLGALKIGGNVNLEPSLRLNDILSGHLVSGHIDGLGELTERVKEGDTDVLTFAYPAELRPFLAKKGSITIDGISLTVGEVTPSSFKVYIIPHTLIATTLGSLQINDRVNLEVDLIARYVQRQLSLAQSSAN